MIARLKSPAWTVIDTTNTSELAVGDALRVYILAREETDGKDTVRKILKVGAQIFVSGDLFKDVSITATNDGWSGQDPEYRNVRIMKITGNNARC